MTAQAPLQLLLRFKCPAQEGIPCSPRSSAPIASAATRNPQSRSWRVCNNLHIWGSPLLHIAMTGHQTYRPSRAPILSQTRNQGSPLSASSGVFCTQQRVHPLQQPVARSNLPAQASRPAVPECSSTPAACTVPQQRVYLRQGSRQGTPQGWSLLHGPSAQPLGAHLSAPCQPHPPNQCNPCLSPPCECLFSSVLSADPTRQQQVKKDFFQPGTRHKPQPQSKRRPQLDSSQCVCFAANPTLPSRCGALAQRAPLPLCVT